MWSRIRVVAPLMLAVSMAIGACGSSADPTTAANPAAEGNTQEDRVLFDTDFQGVCSGAPQAAATAYDKTKSGIHPVLAFSSSTIDKDASSLSTVTIPEGFTKTWQDGANTLAEVELVACAKRTADTVVKSCDGYKKDGVDTGQVVTLHSASYEVTLYAATTGEALANTTIEAPATECPTIVMSNRTDDYAVIDDQMLEFVQPFVKID